MTGCQQKAGHIAVRIYDPAARHPTPPHKRGRRSKSKHWIGFGYLDTQCYEQVMTAYFFFMRFALFCKPLSVGTVYVFINQQYSGVSVANLKPRCKLHSNLL